MQSTATWGQISVGARASNLNRPHIGSRSGFEQLDHGLGEAIVLLRFVVCLHAEPQLAGVAEGQHGHLDASLPCCKASIIASTT